MTIVRQALSMAVTGMTLACLGCAERSSQGVLVPVLATADGTSRVSILAVTTRQRSANPGEMFSGERAAGVSYASIGVSIPSDSARTIGQVQWPATVPGDPRVNF